MRNDNPLEKVIEEKVCDYAKGRGFLVYKFSSPSNAGVCDRIWICNGQTLFVEFKRKGLQPTPLQSRHHQTLAKHGMTVYVVDSVELGKEIIDYESEQKGCRHHESAIRYTGGGKVV